MASALPQDLPGSTQSESLFPLWEAHLLRFAIPLACIVALSGCGQAKELAVSDAWVRLAAAPGRPAAGYFTIRGGATDQTVIAVTTPAAGRVELHETMQHGAAMTMAPIGEVKVPAGATVSFAPGGKHLMLFDVARAVAKGAKVPMTFTFADGHTLAVEAQAIAAGDPAPATGA